MEPPLNCSALSQSQIETTMDRTEALGVLQELCRVSRASDRTQLSAAVQGILGSLLTCGLLLSLFFAIFTVRFRQNRVVKMSSPNLNLVILLGSLVVYVSAFMFAAQEAASSIQTVIQVRISLLYIGVSLVFGPLLGKSWRLHRVFTHRVPDKRVIIKDLTLLGLQAALLFVDSMLLLSWVLSDPVLCAQNVSASIKAAERGTHCAVTRTLSCSSLYADFWVALLLGFKGILLIYGSYLAGLTKNISTPPVNQSLVIMVGTTLVAVSTGVVLLANRFFHNWPNLVYGVTSSSILICTAAINCLIFIPQVLIYKVYKESHTTVQMAKYFNSPSKSMRSMYSEEQIYHLLGENMSMRRLLTEKSAVIDSLQEQVTNAKEKLVQILNSECSIEIPDVSTLSASTLAIQQQVVPFSEATNKAESPETSDKVMDNDTNLDHHVQEEGAMESNVENSQPLKADLQEPPGNDLQPSECSIPIQEAEMAMLSRNVSFMDGTSKPQSESTDKGAEGEAWERLSRKVNYVSSEKLQEILRELSVETLSGGCQLSPGGPRRASHGAHREPTGHSTEGFRNVSLSFSPSMARRRRGLAYSRRNVGTSSQFYKEIPQVDRWVINQGASNKYEGPNMHMEDTLNHISEMRLDETNDDISQHLPSPANNTEVGVQTEGRRVHENGGLWVSKLSDPPNYSRRPSHIITWSHAGQDTHEPLGFRSESPFSESDTSSSEETFCLCHRPYCDICFPHMCETSDSETESADYPQGWPTYHTGSQLVVNFKEDLQPTLQHNPPLRRPVKSERSRFRWLKRDWLRPLPLPPCSDCHFTAANQLTPFIPGVCLAFILRRLKKTDS
ncbi:PREDICTED: probable G-protein coupled receptor 156 [Nanorana parkeri]|uniref:probable G-protein coupled receptor 156 n=1 Tax=Nanorana parkeri TaxID=125878 RepID=UPI000854407E|nr:PREDICTED: probable G-protein coupled receptor 156 [Nanorana parkeri]